MVWGAVGQPGPDAGRLKSTATDKLQVGSRSVEAAMCFIFQFFDQRLAVGRYVPRARNNEGGE